LDIGTYETTCADITAGRTAVPKAGTEVVNISRTTRPPTPLARRDGRPQTQFLRHLKSLAPEVPDDFLRSIWTNCLPPHIQVILAGQSEGSLDSASQLADRICEVAPRPTTASVSSPTDASLLQRLEELSRQVAALTMDRTRCRSHSRHRRDTGNLPTRGPGFQRPGTAGTTGN
jgi:hypothetical protein